jgi:hypothetical protein
VAGDQAKAEAMSELWRSWLTLGGSLGAMPGAGGPGRIAGETLGRFLDPVSLALVGGSQVGETIRRLTEGARFADLGAAERRMARVMELWLAVQQRAHVFETAAEMAADPPAPARRRRISGLSSDTLYVATKLKCPRACKAETSG